MERLSMVTLGALLDDTLVAESSELIFRGRMIAIHALFRVPWIDQLGEHGGRSFIENATNRISSAPNIARPSNREPAFTL